MNQTILKKTDQEIEKMLLDELEETITMGWADTSEKSLLLELIRERQVKNKSMEEKEMNQTILNWNYLIEKNYNTYPDEGHIVLVSDGIHYDIAYFVMSQSYKWVKVTVKDDDINDFDDIKIIKWAYMDTNK